MRLKVEQCLPLRVESFNRSGTWECPSGTTGTSSWTVPQGSLGKIDYTIQNDADGLAIHIHRQDARLCGELRLLEESLIPVTTTRPHFGGKRHWFKCPIVRDGKPCGKRVGRLYLPPGTPAFGCRHCHNLTYRSAREHDKRKGALARNALSRLAALENLARIAPVETP
ncbi:MAG: hypothetical protein WB799_25115 [Candidatus Sulfotelmatobacter sp.]